MTGSYYFRQLDKAGQAAYHAMKTGLAALRPAFPVPRLEGRELGDVLARLRLDCRFHRNLLRSRKRRQRLFQKRHHLLRNLSRAVHGDVCIFLIKRHPLSIDVLQRLSRRKGDTPGRKIKKPRPDLREGELQIGRHTLFFQMLHTGSAVDCTSAGGNHRIPAMDGKKCFFLCLFKGIEAPLVQDLLQKCPFPLLDHQICIQKIHSQSLSQQNADGAFPAAGHPDQCDIFHNRFLFLKSLPHRGKNILGAVSPEF